MRSDDNHNTAPGHGGRRRSSSRDWTVPFLAELRRRPNIFRACRVAGISRSVVYERRDSDPGFARRLREALDDGVDRLVETAWKRAEKKSDQLAVFLLKAHRPEVYGDRLKIDGATVRMEIVEQIVASSAEVAGEGGATAADRPA
jgi:hypothetical protein